MMPACFASPECVLMARGVGARLGLERRASARAASAPRPRSISRQHVVGGEAQPVRRRPAPACGGCPDDRRRARAARRRRSAPRSASSAAARTRTTRPSSARRQSPPRSIVPRSSNEPDLLAAASDRAQAALLPQLERQHQLGIERASAAPMRWRTIEHRRRRLRTGNSAAPSAARVAGSQVSSSPSARTS